MYLHHSSSSSKESASGPEDGISKGKVSLNNSNQSPHRGYSDGSPASPASLDTRSNRSRKSKPKQPTPAKPAPVPAIVANLQQMLATKALRESDQRIASNRASEFKQFQELLDKKDFGSTKKKAKKKKHIANQMKGLTQALEKYKKERNGSENSLIQAIEKVNLDKNIMLREKSKVLFQSQERQNQAFLEDRIRLEKKERFEINKKQRVAYTNMLLYIK